LYRIVGVLDFSATQLHEHEKELLGLRQVVFVSPAHLFAEDGNELDIPLDYAA
jgi:hypothetical protein